MHATPPFLIMGAVRALVHRAGDGQDLDTIAVQVADDYGIPLEELQQAYGMVAANPDDSDAPDEEDLTDEPYRDGPARLHEDDYYARNDAGEYRWM